MANTGRHPKSIALFAVQLCKGGYHVGIAVGSAIAPNNILHVLWKFAEHGGILGHNVAPHQHLHLACAVVGIAVGLLH